GVQALEQKRNVPVAGVARVTYFRETGDHTAALAELSNRRQSGVRPSAFDEGYFAIELYHHGRFQEAVEVLDRGIDGGGDTYVMQVYRCYILAELPDGPARALAASPPVVSSTPFSIYVPTIQQLLGRKSEAVAAYRLHRDTLSQSHVQPDWTDRLLEFNSGSIPADKLLVFAGSSRLNLCEGHFFIGMALLADGDRAGARTHFQRAV